jgi:hypothetical protein
MNLAHLDPVTAGSLVAAAALALTRLLTTAKPLWDRLPASLQGLVPALVLVLPQVAEQAMGVKTGLDLANLLVLAAALILPGAHSHTVALVKPSGPSSAAALLLIAALCLPLSSCSVFTPARTKTAVDIAHDLCVKHYSAEKPGLSIEDITRTYCEDLDPWVSTIVGAEALGAAKASAKAKAAQP